MLKDAYDLARYALRFKANQFENAVIEQKRHYEAAGWGRRAEKWHRKAAGPVADSLKGLRYLRGFSRDLVRNNSYAQRAVKVIATNTVGSGITPSFKGSRSKYAKKKWLEFAGTTACDFYKNMNFSGIQEQVMTAVAESGDALVVRRYNYQSPFGFDVQVLEADFLDETKTLGLRDGGMILQGVQFNSEGRRTGYWLFEKHPAEVANMNSNQSRFVPASEVLHIFEVLRPGQVRGIPMGVSAFIRIKDFDEYQDAQLHQQKVAACFVAFVTNTNMASSIGGSGAPANMDLDITDRLVPGIIEELPFGRDVKFSTPPSIAGSDVYSLTVLRAIAAGYNVTYEAITNDYSNVNFSSGRMGWLEFARVINSWQDKLMITQLCHGVYSWFTQGLQIMEGTRLTLDVTWTTPRREMIDPLKEGAAIIADIKAGVQSRQEAIRQKGYDVEDVEAEIKEDMESENRLGALFTTTVSKSNITDLRKPGEASVKPQVSTLSKK